MSMEKKHISDDKHNVQDTAPGDEQKEEGGKVNGILGYAIGFMLAALLTVASFWIIGTHLVYKPAIPIALITLAIAQMGVHLVFFLHINTSPDSKNNILALAFGLLIVCLIIFGSIWIMNHLNYGMMPMDQLMQMQH